jgi:ATP-dependent protease ClpP protease subunit
MLRYLIVGILWATPALCQKIDFANTKARVSYEADTTWIDGVGPGLGLTIYISGEINRDAVTLVRRYFDGLIEMSRRFEEVVDMKPEYRGASSINFQLNSLGGEVDAAIEIGRFVRDKQGNVLVVENASCASACIFILAGGAYRAVRGTLGIHRPFLETPSRTMTPGDIKNIMTKRQEQLRAFLREMNISERLADDMMVIPSAQMKRLSPQEIALYGLGVDDPVIHESKILQNARKYGLSRIEYETRWRRVQQLCPFGSDDACMENIMKGLPSPRSTAPR